MKRADIKTEDSGQHTDILSKTFECIALVKLFRPAPAKPKYVPQENQSLLGKPVKDFKKFQKQVSQRKYLFSLVIKIALMLSFF